MTAISNLVQHPAWKSWPIVAGLLILYAPTYQSFAQSYWPGEENAHGPIVLAVVIWLVWTLRSNLFVEVEKTNPVSGFALLIFALLLYIVGRSQGIFMFEAGSEIPLLLGILLITHGAGIARKYWYPLLFLVFLIPLPESLMENLTGPLKQHVSVLAENILYDLGYPIARNGVMLSIGPYQLLVADACSGLYSMFSLSAL
ncbi:MAG TPA: archaeosortase/exosortase family protein, partial [Burkholderiales bacterium]|nr:archaeosortase/exosortase family protein [Burkholderiales bacterium]